MMLPADRPLPARRRLAPPWVVAACAAAILLALYLLFPKASVFQQLGRGDSLDRGDSLRVILLRNLIRAGEKAPAVRRDYARQLGLTGDYAGAFGELERLAEEMGPGTRDTVLLLQAEVGLWALSSGDGRDGAARARLRSSLESLLREGSPRHLARAAEQAGAVGEHELAARLYWRLAEEDTQAVAWFRRAADQSAARGDCGAVSAALLAAHARGRTGPERKAAFLDALRALQACGRMKEALAVAETRMGEWRSDPEVLLFLVQLARSANRPRQAEKYAHLLVKPLAAGPEP